MPLAKACAGVHESETDNEKATSTPERRKTEQNQADHSGDGDNANKKGTNSSPEHTQQNPSHIHGPFGKVQRVGRVHLDGGSRIDILRAVKSKVVQYVGFPSQCRGPGHIRGFLPRGRPTWYRARSVSGRSMCPDGRAGTDVLSFVDTSFPRASYHTPPMQATALHAPRGTSATAHTHQHLSAW